MNKGVSVPKRIVFRDNHEEIPNIYDLEKLGAGHDGLVFRYGDKVLKLLKYDINHRKQKGLTTFEKAIYFQDELQLKRIEKPIDVLFDTDGVYTGYVMNYLEDLTLEKKKGTPLYRSSSSFTCGDLIYASSELEDDFSQLTKKQVVAKDINRGSYIFTFDFLHLCDMDKYRQGCSTSYDLNRCALNFVLAKFLYYEMLKTGNYDKQQLKMLSKWVKKSSNSRSFLSDLKKEIGSDYSCPIGEYADYKVKSIVH